MGILTLISMVVLLLFLSMQILLADFGLLQHISQPTRVFSSSSTPIVHVISSSNQMFIRLWV